jgi:hypothetical protein
LPSACPPSGPAKDLFPPIWQLRYGRPREPRWFDERNIETHAKIGKDKRRVTAPAKFAKQVLIQKVFGAGVAVKALGIDFTAARNQWRVNGVITGPREDVRIV